MTTTRKYLCLNQHVSRAFLNAICAGVSVEEKFSHLLQEQVGIRQHFQ